MVVTTIYIARHGVSPFPISSIFSTYVYVLYVLAHVCVVQVLV